MSGSTVRLFTALWPPPAVRDALAAMAAAWQWPEGAARVDPGRYHVTLHFLGPVPLERMADLQAGLAVPPVSGALETQTARQAVWPGGIAVLEFDAPAPLQSLHARLGQALEALGFALDKRPWRPHVTFARKAQHARPAAAPPLPPWPVEQGFALVCSTPGRGYETLARFGAGDA